MGLRSKVSLIIFASLLGCFLIMGLLIHGMAQRRMTESINRQMTEANHHVSLMVKEFMDGSIEEVEGFAGDKNLQAAILSWNVKEIDRRLEDYAGLFKKFESFFVFDKDGYVRALTTPGKATLGKYYGHRAYFQRAMQSKKTALGDPVIGGSIKKPAVHIAVPIHDRQGEIYALLVGALPLFKLSRQFENIKVGRGGLVILVSLDGKILAHPDSSKLFTSASETVSGFKHIQEKNSGVFTEQKASGQGHLYTWTTLAPYGWTVVAQHPTQEVYKPLKTMRRVLFLGILPILLVAVAACAYFVDRYVLRPIKKIQANLSEVTAGRVPPHDLIKSGDELQILAENISDMADSLHQSYENLSKRNQELTVLNTIAAVSSQSLEVQEILETTLDKVLELMNLRVGNVRLYDPLTKKLILAAHRGVTPQYLQKFREIDLDDHESYAVQAIMKNQPLLVKDIRENPRLKEALFPGEDISGPLCLVSVPMKIKDKIIGTMGFVSDENRCCAPEVVDIFTSIGHQLAVAIEKATLLKAEREAREKEQERLKELGILFTTGRLLTTSMNLDEILKTIVDTSISLLGVGKCNLMLKDEEGNLLFAYTKGIPQDFLNIGKLSPGESLSGWIAGRGEVLYVPDINEDPRFMFPALGRKHGFYSLLGVPLKVEQEVIGVLNVYTDQYRAFSEQEIRLLSTIGDYAAIAILQARDRQKLETQILQRHRELSTLNAISSTLSRSLDLNRVLEDAVDMIMLVMEAEKAAIFLRENSGLYLVVHRGFSPALAQRLAFLRGEECLVWKELTDREINIHPQIDQALYAALPELREENIQSAIDVRLRSKNQNLGFLTLFYHQPREFGETERHLMVSIGHQVAAAVENAQLYQRTLHSYQQLQVVSEINSEISTQLDLGSLLFLIARRAAELIGADASIIALRDRQSGKVHPRGWFNMPEAVKDHPLVFSEAEWRAMGWLERGLLWNQERNLPLEGLAEGQSPIRSLMIQPLHSFSDFSGLILLINFAENKFFKEEDREVLALLAGQGEVAIQNAQYIKEITDLDQQREDYLSNVSHELRTPVTLIRGYTEAIKEGAVEGEEEQQKCLDIIIKECERLTRLVEGLLILPRLELDDPQKTLRMSLVNLNEIMDSCLLILKPELEEKRITLENQMPLYPQIWADYDMIFLVIFNLLNNALKFTPREGKIFLTGETRKDELEVMLRDTGRGIPPEHLDKVFDKFYMIDSGLTKKQRGMGLGLYISRKIVELHRGRIWVKSEVGRGTSFYVTLPRAE